jgi:HSP20 family molecular chaperone IbpA
MRDSNTVNIAGVAKKPLIVTVHRNQLIIKSLRFLLKGQKKMQSMLN